MWEYNYNYSNELYHYGIKGMKWGVRRNRTTIGNRYHTRAAKSVQKDADSLRKHGYKAEADAVQKVADKHRQKASDSQRRHDERTPMSTKKKAAIGAAVVGTVLAAYGAKKLHDVVRDKNFTLRLKQAEKYIDANKNRAAFSKYIGMPTEDAIAADRRYSKMVDDTFDRYVNKAKNDSFRTAFKNVASDEIAKKKRRR